MFQTYSITCSLTIPNGVATTSDTVCTVAPDGGGASTTITVPAGQTSAAGTGYSDGMYTVSVPDITIGGNTYTKPSSNSVTISGADQTSSFSYTQTVSTISDLFLMIYMQITFQYSLR